MTANLYRFGPFTLDTAARELWWNGEEQGLPRKVFDCLVYLVEHRDRAVGRDELVQAIWQHTNLTEGTLDQAIFQLRRALDDTSREQRCIKTVRGFGYHWVATVEADTATSQAGLPEAHARRRPIRPWVIAAAIAGITVVALISALDPFERLRDVDAGPVPVRADASDIALVLPVEVAGAEQHGWIRLGAMELIAERLRAAGLSTVPGETVIVLLQDVPDESERSEGERLRAATGARLLIRARAEPQNGGWRVTLRGTGPESAPIRALGEAGSVLDAARLAADRIALSLGLTPPPGPDALPGVTALLQRTRAAILAGQWDVARGLVEDADPEMRRRPEIRLQRARIDLYSRNVDAAEKALKTLLAESSVRNDKAFRARTLITLGGVHYARGDTGAVRRLLLEATALLEGTNRPDHMCDIWNNLGLLANRRGDDDAARSHLARARLACEAVGNLQGQANTDLHLGGLELQQEHFSKAAAYFQRAAERYTALHSIDGELRARANAALARLEGLELSAANALEPRIEDLLALADSPSLRVYAAVVRARLLAETGRLQAANEQVTGVLEAAGGWDTPAWRPESLLLLAGHALRENDHALAARLAAAIVTDREEGQPVSDRLLARARFIEILTAIARSDLPAADAAANALADWADDSRSPSARIHAALARALVAAADNRAADAHTAFDQALSRARTSRIPRDLLRVARHYIGWLLNRDTANPTRALTVASHLAHHADHHFDAALLQLRTAHALATPVSWRNALERARNLAGERKIPERLQTAPAAAASGFY